MKTTLRDASGRLLMLALFAGAFIAVPRFAAPVSAAPCVGDCNNNGTVAVNELITGVNISLEQRELAACPGFDSNGNGRVAVNELIQGVNSSLNGCESGPTPTPTEVPGCALEAGAYTLTQVEGGTLAVGTITDFAFPAGGTFKMDVSEGDENCVHEAIVPADGGFEAPVFCIVALSFSVDVSQSGCGIGRIDSNGGSDFTITEQGDTSDSSDVCNLPASDCSPGVNSSVRIDVEVGDGTPDTCPGGGLGNAVISVPVYTTTWSEAAGCPAPDGVYNPGVDTLITEFPQILDFTTDVNAASWVDLDGDGCSIAGVGLNSTSGAGVCIDFTENTVTTAAAGTIGSAGPPLFDISYRTILPNVLSGPETAMGATCDPAPIINFNGEATRCIE